MSYRELRNFCEIMRSLGYPRTISMDNFRTANFKLVAEITFWLIKRFDPKADVPDSIEDEKARVEFIKAACIFFCQNLKVKLNPKKVYAADGNCVQELIKVAEIFYNAKKSVSLQNDYDYGKELDITSRKNDIENMKNLSKDIVELGINLLDLLDKEKGLKFARETAIEYLDGISKNYDNQKDEEIEKKIMTILSNQEKDLEQLDTHVNELKARENELGQDVQVKRIEMERAEKRLESLYHAQPGHLAELADCEEKLSSIYRSYVEKIRNHDYLQSRLDKYQNLEEMNKRILRGQLEKKRENEKKRFDDHNDQMEYDEEMEVDQYQQRAINKNIPMNREGNNMENFDGGEEELEGEEEENPEEDDDRF